MTARAPDLSAEAAVRQAVAFGKQAAIREVVDALYAERDQRCFGKRVYDEGQRAVFGTAIDLVKSMKIDPREDPA